MGLRQGEALALRWQDVDLEAGRLHVRHGLQWIKKTDKRHNPRWSNSRPNGVEGRWPYPRPSPALCASTRYARCGNGRRPVPAGKSTTWFSRLDSEPLSWAAP